MGQIAESKRKGKGGLDFHPTHPAWTRVLLKEVSFAGHTITEPCCGDGAITRVLENEGLIVKSSDIHDYGHGYEVKNAFEYKNPWHVVTNPPYNVANDLAVHFLEYAIGQVALLMRLAWLQGKERRQRIFDPCPPYKVIIVNGRMPLPNGEHSQYPHVWIVWDRLRYGEGTELLWRDPIF